MFFKDIVAWSQKKLRLLYISFVALYYIFTLIVPIIIIGVRYDLFARVSDNRVTGWCLIIILVIVILALRSLGKFLNKLPDLTLKQQRLKYTLMGVKALFIPIVIIILVNILKNDFSFAAITIVSCSGSFIAGIIVDYVCIKYIEKELELREKANEKIEIEKRVERQRS